MYTLSCIVFCIPEMKINNLALFIYLFILQNKTKSCKRISENVYEKYINSFQIYFEKCYQKGNFGN